LQKERDIYFFCGEIKITTATTCINLAGFLFIFVFVVVVVIVLSWNLLFRVQRCFVAFLSLVIHISKEKKRKDK